MLPENGTPSEQSAKTIMMSKIMQKIIDNHRYLWKENCASLDSPTISFPESKMKLQVLSRIIDWVDVAARIATSAQWLGLAHQGHPKVLCLQE